MHVPQHLVFQELGGSEQIDTRSPKQATLTSFLNADVPRSDAGVYASAKPCDSVNRLSCIPNARKQPAKLICIYANEPNLKFGPSTRVAKS